MNPWHLPYVVHGVVGLGLALGVGWLLGACYFLGMMSHPVQDGCALMSAAEVAVEKPRMRGVLHQFAAAVALGAGLVLVSMAPSARAATGAALFAVSLVTLFTVSATYHRVNWSVGARVWMRRMDHASIFILIAGTYTPVALMGLPEASGNSLLRAIWAGALLGVLQSLFWVNAPKVLTAVLAVGVGWTLVPYMGEAYRSLGATQLALILTGGVAYTIGAVAYASKRPNPLPGVFGYHEVFHALTIVGAVLHFIAVLLLVRSAPV